MLHPAAFLLELGSFSFQMLALPPDVLQLPLLHQKVALLFEVETVLLEFITFTC